MRGVGEAFGANGEVEGAFESAEFTINGSVGGAGLLPIGDIALNEIGGDIYRPGVREEAAEVGDTAGELFG
jgi:hypothetical protein